MTAIWRPVRGSLMTDRHGTDPSVAVDGATGSKVSRTAVGDDLGSTQSDTPVAVRGNDRSVPATQPALSVKQSDTAVALLVNGRLMSLRRSREWPGRRRSDSRRSSLTPNAGPGIYLTGNESAQ